MRRDKPSSKQSEPATLHGRQVAYDREMCIAICRRFLLGEDFQAICAKPPMPIPAMFLAWVQHHQEAREIHRCARNFLSDRKLAKELGAPWVVAVTDWAEEVRAKLERGWPVDYLDRKYIPPDWNKVYPSLGYPPVVAQVLAGAETGDTVGTAMEAAPPLGPAGEAADASQPVPRPDEPATAAPRGSCIPVCSRLAKMREVHARSVPRTRLRKLHPRSHPQAGLRKPARLRLVQRVVQK
jgi:hypothetical protein